MKDSEFYTDFGDAEGDDLIGQKIAHYRIVAPLGRGGMGVVYAAEDEKLKRRVALKVLPRELADDHERLARFRREAESLAALNHANIVTLYSIEESEGLHILTMEEVVGQSLDELLPREGMPFEQWLDVAVALTDALSAAHDKGIVHRDIKPSNLMLTSDGRLKVLDFGLAKARSGNRTGNSAPEAELVLTQEQTIVGTAPYMSPEQIQGHPVDGRSDIFSLGVVLYELATGRRPFEGRTGPVVMSKILESEALPIRESRKDLSVGVERIVARCLRKAPEERYQEPSEIAVDLGLLGGRPGGGLRSAVTRSIPSRILALVLIVALISAGFYLRSRNNPADEPEQAGLGIVVMPFENAGDADDDYFAAGMTNGIASRLSEVAELRVISPRNLTLYSDMPPHEIGEQLGVDYLLYGRVFLVEKANERRVVVTPELIKAADGSRVWQKPPYDHAVATVPDQLEIQERIAADVLDRLGLDPGLGTIDRSNEHLTRNPEAYKAYLRARYFHEKRNAADLDRAIRYYEAAVAKDPDFLLARLGLAQMPLARVWYCLKAPLDVFPFNRPKILSILEFAPDLSEACAVAAIVAEKFDNDFERAEELFRRAIRPCSRFPMGLPSGHHWYGGFLSTRGRHEEALQEALTAQHLDPVSPIFTTWVGLRHYYAGRSEEALEQFDRALELDRSFAPAHWHRSWAAAAAGRLDEALEDARSAATLGEVNKVYGINLAWVYALRAESDKADRILDELRGRDDDRYLSHYHLAAVQVARGRLDEAFTEFDAACTAREMWCHYVMIDPRMRAMRDDPRFAARVAALGY